MTPNPCSCPNPLALEGGGGPSAPSRDRWRDTLPGKKFNLMEKSVSVCRRLLLPSSESVVARPISHFPAGRSPTIYNSLENFSGVPECRRAVWRGRFGAIPLFQLTLPPPFLRWSVINQRRLKTVSPSTSSSPSVRCLFSPVYDTAESNVQLAHCSVVAVVAGASH